MQNIFNIIKQILLLSALILVWFVVVAFYFNWSFAPLNILNNWLMPWQNIHYNFTNHSIGEPLIIMQDMLESSYRLSNIALLLMLFLLGILTFHLTLFYQQKQRRTEENKLLRLKNQEIVRRNEFIQYISSTIGHEFKNNLGRIKRRIDLLHDIAQDEREKIAHNMDKLFADIDIFKKISDKREQGLVHFERVDLMEMLLQLSNQNNDLIDMRVVKSEYSPVIYASRTLIKTVFENLIDNSIKYKKPAQEHAQLTVSFSIDTDGSRRYLTLIFKDCGIGMDEVEQDRCFYKGKGFNKDGWGRGLYFAKYVIGLHAGKIKVGKEFTKPANGTEIIINLPFVKEDIYV